MEEILIKKIEGAIRAIRLGNKTPKELASEVSHSFAKLKTLNEGMAEELMGKYKNVLADRNKNQK